MLEEKMLHRNRFTNSPDARPPADVRFTELRVEPWPDGRRIRVHVSLTPFQKNPNLDAAITDANGREVSRASIIETAEVRFVFTMHIRSEDVGGIYTLSANLNYEETGQVDARLFNFEIHPPAKDNEDENPAPKN